MTPAKPSLNLLRSLTDEHVLRTLFEHRRLTRAELASRTGISKPTVSESVRRLVEGGLLRDTGERTTGRGGVGTYYALAGDIGVALVVGIGPDGVVAEAVGVHGQVVCREEEEAPHAASPEQVSRSLQDVAGRVVAGAAAPVRLSVVSAADPVDRASGRLVHLPDAPFLTGELSPVDALGRLVDGPVMVDNDVNWAARAERTAAGSDRLDDFAYLYLGEGLGCAVVADGEVRRGHGGLAGEISHVQTRGSRGSTVAFTEVFAQLRLRQSGSTAIDVTALLRALEGDSGRSRRVRDVLAEATGGVIAAAVALLDPEVVVVGGTWGTHPAFVEALTEAARRLPRQVHVRTAEATDEPALTGARQRAVRDLQAAVIARLQAGDAAPVSLSATAR